MLMSEKNTTDRDGGNGGDDADGGDGKRRKGDDKSFDLATFHQLRLERLENRRRAERPRGQGDGREGRPRWSSTASSPSITINSIKTARGGSSRSIETNAIEKLSAQRELLRLGQRYASFASSVPRRGLSSSEQTSPENIELHEPAFPSSTDDSSASQEVPEVGGGPAASEKSAVHRSEPFLDINARSPSATIEVLSHDDNGPSVVTHDGKIASKVDVGTYGSHYLLLARANPPPIPGSKVDRDGDLAIDADDGSSSASYGTPAPHLQAASACNSHGENEDECEAQEDAEMEKDHISILTSGTEDAASGRGDAASGRLDPPTGPCKSDVGDNNLARSRKPIVRRILHYAIRSALVAFAGATIFFCWRYIVKNRCKVTHRLHSMPGNCWSLESMQNAFDSKNRYKVTYPGMFPLLPARLHSMSAKYLSLETVQNAFNSKIGDGLRRALSPLGRAASRSASSAKAAWRTAVAIHADRTKDVHFPSWIVRNVDLLEKECRGGLLLFDATRYGFLEVRDSSAAAWNATLWAAISLWRNFEGAPPSRLFRRSNERVAIGRATLTTPIVFRSDDGRPPEALGNETLALSGDADDVESVFRESNERIAIGRATLTTSIIFRPNDGRPPEALGNETPAFSGDADGVKSMFHESNERIAIGGATPTTPIIFRSNDVRPPEASKNETPAFSGDADGVESMFRESNERIAIGGATPTTPIIFRSNDVRPPEASKNETLAFWGDEDGVESTSASPSPQFWRRSIGGTPFVRPQLPSLGHGFRRCIHSIPSLETRTEADRSPTTPWHVPTSPASKGLRPEGRSDVLFPVGGLGRSRLVLDSRRLDGVSTSPDIFKNAAALMIVQRSGLRRSGRNIPRQQPSQAMVTEERNYYTSSYHAHGQSHEKDVFDDVDVMGMAREFVGRLLKREASSKRRRLKDPLYVLNIEITD